MPSCVFRRCTNYDAKVNKTQGISYHMFPTNPLVLREWILAVREQRREYDWMPSKSSRVCSDHFRSEHKYISSQGRMLLRKDAIPVVEKYEGYHIPIIFPGDDCKDTQEVEEIVVLPTIEMPMLHINSTNYKKRKVQSKKKGRAEQKKKVSKKFTSMEIILKILRKRNYISLEQFNELKLKTKLIDLINIMHRRRNSKKRNKKRYPLALKKFALTLNFYSFAAYKYVRRRFHTALPHQKVLATWYQNSSASPGFTRQAFNLLKRKCNTLGKPILCNLVADLIPIRHQTRWTGKKSEGLVDFGIASSTSDEIATHVYVFILVALNESWRMPVGYFFVKSVPAKIRAYLIRTCISKCSQAGAEVIAVTFDGCASNLAVANLLGCNLSTPNKLKTTFRHPGCRKEVAVMFDSNYMIRLVRNIFERRKIFFNADDKKVRWQLIVALKEILTSKRQSFVNTKSQQYINFRNELLRLKLSTQLLSRNIVHALKLCHQLKLSSKIKDIDATVEFILIFNDLFDILNARITDKCALKQPIGPYTFDKILKVLDKAKQYILSLSIYNRIRHIFKGRKVISLNKKRIVECKSKTGFLGFLICIQSLKHLYASYVFGTPPLLPHIVTHNFTQGSNEIFFGLTRRACGSNRNLDAVQFKDVYVKIFNLLQLLPRSMNGNCVSIEHIPILPYSASGIENINFSSGIRALEENEEIVDTILSDEYILISLSILIGVMNTAYCLETVKLIIGYISSCIASKLINVIKCDVCVDALYTDRKMWYHKLISLRDLNGLCLSSENVFTVCLKSERFIKPYLNEIGTHLLTNRGVKKLKINIMKTFIGTNIFESLQVHSMQLVPAFNHRMHLIKSIIDEFIDIRLRFLRR